MRKHSSRMGEARHRPYRRLHAATAMAVLLVATVPQAWAYVRTAAVVPALEFSARGEGISTELELPSAVSGRDAPVHHEPEQLGARLPSERTSSHTDRTAHATRPHGPPRSFRPGPGEPVFRLSIPAIGLHELVRHGADAPQLARGPGHYPSCGRGFAPPYCSDFKDIWPGERGRVVVGGHRTLAHADFFRLGELRRGDRVVVRAAWGRFIYRVSRLEVVLPSDRTIIVPPSERRELALVTCHPKFSAARRLIVHARLDERAGGLQRWRFRATASSGYGWV
ncbi:MAG: sortase [Actinobacteria bacterium]|nr:sortase [Actinomycetota bacterium]